MKLNLSEYFNGNAYKIIRCFVVAMLFIGVVTLQGMTDNRQAHQIIFMLAVISLFSLILKNIWISLFLLWTVFLYSFFKFTVGSIYLSNIFFGCIYYLIVKVSFRKKDINFLINGILWFVAANLVYMTIQVSGYDFIYSKWAYQVFAGFGRYQIDNFTPYGFMGSVSILGSLIAMAIPLLASRGSKTAWIGAFGLLIPLYILKTSLCFVMGGAGLLFVLYFRIPKRIFLIAVVLLAVLCSFYVKKIDAIGVERFAQWHKVLRDCMIHPVTGWGLDSFANVTPQKDFRYTQSIDDFIYKGEEAKRILWWDNPHNLYISLLFEFGAIGLFLFIGYIRQNILKFKNSLKELNVIGLAGFIFVFLGVSMGHFPIFLARTAICIIPVFSLIEVATE